MKGLFVRSVSMLAVGASAIVWSLTAAGQTVVVQPSPPPAPPPSPAPVVVQPSPAPPAAAEPSAPATTVVGPGVRERPLTRPNRRLLMSGLIVFGAPYVASVSIAATSSHAGDSNLWVPAFGPWLDLGARGGCPADGDCGAETGNRVLLVGDGILQTVGALEIVGAFVFPERYTVTTVAGDPASGPYVAVSPARLGIGGYGLEAAGRF